MYLEKDIVRIARRENNSKRGYLVLNALQGKHLPASPGEALRMFATLAAQVQAGVMGERVLVVGFAETATAIGAAIATALGCPYLQTTRETVPGCTYLQFTEAHSHATEQKLDYEALAAVLPEIDRVVFAEDELTTGNTILNLVNALEGAFERPLRFAAACLLSGMTEETRAVFDNRGVALHALRSIDHSGYTDQALACSDDGYYYNIPPANEDGGDCTYYPGRLDARRLVDGVAYRAACETLWHRVADDFPSTAGERVLVLGTEEFMFPGLLIAAQMEQGGGRVRFHATTRSPIAVSAWTAYPLHTRYTLKSLYDAERTTFLYELATYDKVFIVTDAPPQQKEGLRTLLAALGHAGNTTIHVIGWCDD